MKTTATTVGEYLASLPEERRAAIAAVRDVIRRNLDGDYAEGIQYGMIGYYVPHAVFPQGYHCDPRQPLPFAGLASQKNHMAIYLMCVYGDVGTRDWFVAEWKKAGKKVDMGKSCIRFKKLDDLALDVIGKAVARVSAKQYIERYEKILSQGASARKPASKGKTAGKFKASAKGKPKAAEPKEA